MTIEKKRLPVFKKSDATGRRSPEDNVEDDRNTDDEDCTLDTLDPNGWLWPGDEYYDDDEHDG